jgi:hypothetical protein
MTPLDAIERVHTALTGLARALESGQPDHVLAAEQPLAEAAGALATIDRAALKDPVHLRARLLETRLALQRCRSLGEASAELLERVHPTRSNYERDGQRRLPAVPSRAVNSKV